MGAPVKAHTEWSVRRHFRRAIVVGRVLVLLGVLGGLGGLGAAMSAAARQQIPFTIRVDAQLVIETVSVKDNDGKTIEDLTAQDFVITEDGVPQTISVFEFQRLDNNPRSAEAVTQPSVPSVIQNQISAERPGDIRYQDRRLLVLYFDMMATPPPDQFRALLAARQFIQRQMQPADLIAIMTFSKGAVRVLQDFTDNRNQLAEVMDTLIYPDDDADDADDLGGAFGQDAGEFNIFYTDRQLAALQTAVKMLGVLNEQKSLIYFASGLRLNGVDNQAQLRSTVNSAIRANVAFFPVDARGLVALPPLGDATRSSPGGIGIYTGTAAFNQTANFQRSQDTLYALAADTGGKALLDNNDLAAGIVQAQQAMTSYYLIGYYTTNTALDGKFRRVKISLKEINAKLSYREGYFAGKEFSKFTDSDKERQLEDALMLGDPITDLTIAMELNYFQLNRAEYFVPLTVKIPGSELALAKRGGAERTVIDFIGEVKDDYGTTIQNLRDKVDIKLSDETANQLAKSPVQYDAGFTLLPGKYVIKLLARDAETGRIGTYQRNFVIPNLMKEEKRLPISSVVLSSQRVEMKDALYNAGKKDAAAQAANPLVQNGQKVIPSVTRVFSRSRNMYVYFQAYERNAVTTQPLVAFVSFYRGQAKAFETAPVAIKDGLDPRSKAVPVGFSIDLIDLPAGEYTCQVTVLDPTGRKVAFWQAPVMLIP